MNTFDAKGYLGGKSVPAPAAGSIGSKYKFYGKRLDELLISVVLTSKEDCKELIEFLEVHKHCFVDDKNSQ